MPAGVCFDTCSTGTNLATADLELELELADIDVAFGPVAK